MEDTRIDEDQPKMDFQAFERREISLLQLWLLQDRLNGDIGTFGLRIEGDVFQSEQVAYLLYIEISAQIHASAISAFILPDEGAPRVDISLQGWKPGSI